MESQILRFLYAKNFVIEATYLMGWRKKNFLFKNIKHITKEIILVPGYIEN